MNKALLSLMVFTLVSIYVHGQFTINCFTDNGVKADDKFDAGVLITSGISSIHESGPVNSNWGPEFSYGGGVFALYAPIKNLAFQTELLYNTHKAHNSQVVEMPGLSPILGDKHIKSSTLQIPISVLFSPNYHSNIVTYYVGAGLYGAIPLSGDYNAEYDYTRIYSTYINLNSYNPSLLYGYNLMLGVKITDTVAELRYSYDMNGLGYDNNVLFNKQNNWYVRLNLGYSFF